MAIVRPFLSVTYFAMMDLFTILLNWNMFHLFEVCFPISIEDFDLLAIGIRVLGIILIHPIADGVDTW